MESCLRRSLIVCQDVLDCNEIFVSCSHPAPVQNAHAFPWTPLSQCAILLPQSAYRRLPSLHTRKGLLDSHPHPLTTTTSPPPPHHQPTQQVIHHTDCGGHAALYHPATLIEHAKAKAKELLGVGEGGKWV